MSDLSASEILTVQSFATAVRDSPIISSYYSAIPTALDTPTYYVSLGARASDANDGLSWGTAKATIAGAIAEIGGTADNTNPAIIHVGVGDHSVVATLDVRGVVGFKIRGEGRRLTQLTGPDADPMVLAVNCQHWRLEDLTYLGSPSGDGWAVEFQSNFGGAAFVGGVASANNGAVRCEFGVAANAAAYGLRWTLYGGDVDNDANNDQGVVESCVFFGVDQPIEIGHSNSLGHQIRETEFINCGNGVLFRGGSATLHDCKFGGSGSDGYMIDLQAPAGTSSFGAPSQPIYRHSITVTDVQTEATGMGWVRSHADAAATLDGARTACEVHFVGGNLYAGGVGGAGSDVVTWEATGPGGVTFTAMRCASRQSNGIVTATSVDSRISFHQCDIVIGTFEWAGTLTFVSCYSLTAIVWDPIDDAVHTEIECSGAGFMGRYAPPLPALMQMGPWQRDDVAASLTDDPIALAGATTHRNHVMIGYGDIVGIVVSSNAARVAGSLTAEVTRNGAGTGLVAVLDGANTVTSIATQDRGIDTFTPGVQLGVRITTAFDWSPITADIIVEVLVVTRSFAI